MYRVYLYYLRGQRSKDFESQGDAVSYAEKMLSRSRVAHVQVEDVENCKVVFERFSQVQWEMKK